MKAHIKKGDKVMVIAGNQKGKIALVDKVLLAENTAILQDVNLVSKHKKPSSQFPQGGIIKEAAPIHLSNLQLVDKNNKPQRTGRKLDADGRSVRYFKKSGEVVK